MTKRSSFRAMAGKTPGDAGPTDRKAKPPTPCRISQARQSPDHPQGPVSCAGALAAEAVCGRSESLIHHPGEVIGGARERCSIEALPAGKGSRTG
jgi:hypothetical protein